MGKTVNYNSFPDLDFPPAPWSWSDGNGYNSNTYIFCGAEPIIDMEFIEIPDDCDFMAIDDKKLAAFIVQAVNAYEAHQSLVTAARAMLERYVQLVNCGDCGNWNPETEADVIALRAALPLQEQSNG